MFTPEEDKKARAILARMSQAKARLEELLPLATTPLDAGRDPQPIIVDLAKWQAASTEFDAATKEWDEFMGRFRRSMA